MMRPMLPRALDSERRGGRSVADHRARGGSVLVATHLPIELPDALPIRLGAA